MIEFHPEKYYNTHSIYQENTLVSKFFKHEDILLLVKTLHDSDNFKVLKIGESTEGRDIFSISFGTGKIKILAWTQMHGNEPTATQVFFDIVNFINSPEEQNSDVDFLLEQLQVTFIPMLNPDGAQYYQRENSVGIDINRDAVKLQSPEAQILNNLYNEIKPNFAFNLHDQDPWYAAGDQPNTTAISFLAPPYNEKREINIVRETSMKVIADIVKSLNDFIPDNIAKYSDEFEPRAFGDNFVKDSTSTILIEAGRLINDPNKSEIRKLYFLSLLSGLFSIANSSFNKFSIEDYKAINFNKNIFFDLLIKDISLNNQIVDIGIRLYEKPISNFSKTYFESKIEEIGDLSKHYGIKELECKRATLVFPEISSDFPEIDKLSISRAEDFLKSGIAYLYHGSYQREKYCDLPINLVTKNANIPANSKVGEPANFFIKEDEELRYAVLNGFLFDFYSGKNQIRNGLIL